MVKRIAIVGTHSTGKSTLLQDFKALYEKDPSQFPEGIVFNKQVNRECHKYGLKINEDAGDLTQLYIATNDFKQVVEFPKEKTVISDRCLLDTLVYSHSMFQKKKISLQTLQTIHNLFEVSMGEFTHLVWLRPDFGPVDDGVRSVNKAWRDEIDIIFEKILTSSNLDLVVLNLSGTPEERVESFKKLILE